MIRKSFLPLAAALCCLFAASYAQDAAQPGLTEEQRKEKAALEGKAIGLLDQAIAEAQSLKLPENRLRVQIAGGDLLWVHDEARARALFASAASGIAEMMRGVDATDQRYFGQVAMPAQLRSELLSTVAKRDASLAYQYLTLTRQPAPPPGARNPRGGDAEANLEQNLLAQIAASDPKLALQNAEELLNKGQYPPSIARMLSQLQSKDKEAAAKFGEKLVKRLQSESVLANSDAGSLALSLLQPGPRSADVPTTRSNSNFNSPVLGETSYKELLESVIAVALKAAPPSNSENRDRDPQRFRGGRNNPPAQGSAQTPPTDAQREQTNARMLLARLQSLLPQIDKYLPAKAPAVKQKLTSMGFGNAEGQAMTQINYLMREGTAESLLAAAASVPQEMRNGIYRQALQKAINEGKLDLARKIAGENLDPAFRETALQNIELRQAAVQAEAAEMEKIRQSLGRLRSDEERVDMLIQLSASARKNNPALAVALLDEALAFLPSRARNYQQLESQLRVAHALGAIDPARSFEALAPGIDLLNDLLLAAATLSGFESNAFKEGEFQMQGGGRMSGMVNRYGQELAILAKTDFDKAQSMADKFQHSESRIIAKMAIVRGIFGVDQSPPMAFGNNQFGGRGGFGPGGPQMGRPR